MGKKVIEKSLVFTIIGLCILVNVFTSSSNSTIVNDFSTTKNNLPAEHRVIMCTGFWNPTGLMLIPFSTDPEINPDGWQGENWEGLGYDIFSYFPKPGDYTGMFEVDYQNTWQDFWNVTDQIHPFAIISFGAGPGQWKIEYNARNLDVWINDEELPYQPTPCPPDDTKPVGYVRHSSLPVQQIADAVNSQTTIDAWVDWYGNPGMYLCEYIAYLGMWYQDIHNTTQDLYPCRAAGFIHTNSGVALNVAMNATKITIRETISYLSSINYSPETPVITGQQYGDIGEECTYNFSTRDADMDDVFYYIDWGDGTNSSWVGPYNSSETGGANHTWASSGTYQVKVKAKDTFQAESPWSDTLSVQIGVSNTAPNKPSKPSGNIKGTMNVEYTYTTNTTDPDGNQVYYLFDWGDGTNSSWVGPYASGATGSAKHTWTVKGPYQIKVKAKDTNSAESPWSDPLSITMPFSYQTTSLQFLQKLFQRFPNAFPILRYLIIY